MIANNTDVSMDKKGLLSTLWIFVLLNVIFRDIHELFRPGLLAEMMTGTVNGVQMSEGVLLAAGIALEILLVMVILSRVLAYRVNRWANIIVGILAIGYVVGNANANLHDLDDIFFAGIEVVTAFVIVWLAWTWSESEATGEKI